MSRVLTSCRINHPDVYDGQSRAGKRWRKKFRLPRVLVDRLVAKADRVPEFADKPAGPGHGRGAARHPLLLKVLASLRMLAKGCDAETVEDAAQISEACLRRFHKQFVEWLGTCLYAEQVKRPTGAHLDASLHVYEQLGFPGAYCSSDGVHFPWDCAPAVRLEPHLSQPVHIRCSSDCDRTRRRAGPAKSFHGQGALPDGRVRHLGVALKGDY